MSGYGVRSPSSGSTQMSSRVVGFETVNSSNRPSREMLVGLGAPLSVNSISSLPCPFTRLRYMVMPSARSVT